MRDPLSAVAVYATGGRTALEQFGKKRGGADLRLTRQIINASGSLQYHCKACGAYGILERTERATEEKEGLIINVYQERSSMRGIERTFGVSRTNIERLVKRTGEWPPTP